MPLRQSAAPRAGATAEHLANRLAGLRSSLEHGRQLDRLLQSDQLAARQSHAQFTHCPRTPRHPIPATQPPPLSQAHVSRSAATTKPAIRLAADSFADAPIALYSRTPSRSSRSAAPSSQIPPGSHCPSWRPTARSRSTISCMSPHDNFTGADTPAPGESRIAGPAPSRWSSPSLSSSRESQGRPNVPRDGRSQHGSGGRAPVNGRAAQRPRWGVIGLLATSDCGATHAETDEW